MSSAYETAPRWMVEAEYRCNAQVGDILFLKDRVRLEYEEKASKEGCKLESFNVKASWMEWNWQALWWEYHIKIEAIISGSPIAMAVILAILGVIELALIVVAIYLVGEEVIKPLFAPTTTTPFGIPSGWLIIGLIFLFLLLWGRKD